MAAVDSCSVLVKYSSNTDPTHPHPGHGPAHHPPSGSRVVGIVSRSFEVVHFLLGQGSFAPGTQSMPNAAATPTGPTATDGNNFRRGVAMFVSPPTAVLGDPTGARAAAVMIKYAAPAAVLASPPGDVFEAPRLACNFADRAMRYPLHTPAAVWTSAAGFLDAGGADAEVAGRLKAAFDYHRLPGGEWARLVKAAADSQTPAPPHTAYALPAQTRYPLDDAAQIAAAAAYFHKYAARFDPDTRRTYATNLVAAGGGVLPVETLAKLEAEAGYARPAVGWADEFAKRAAMSTDPGLTAAMTKTAAAVAAGGFPAGVFKNAGEIAELLRQVDRRMGWDFPDPLSGLTGETPSTARAKLAGAVEATTGDWYAATDLDRLPNAEFTDLVGGSPIVTRAAKAAALRDPARARFVATALADHGVQPVSRARPKTPWATLAAGGS